MYVDLDDARMVVKNMYKSDKWREKVRRMPDRQVLAIFFRLTEKPPKKTIEEKPKDNHIVFEPYVGEQLSLF